MKTASILHLPESPTLANIEAEQSLLGALLLSNDAYAQVGDLLDEKHFYEPVHVRIFAAISHAVRKGNSATPITLKEQFDRDPALSDIGGGTYLAKLAWHGVTVLDIADHAKVVSDLAAKRRLLDVCQDAIGRLTSSETTKTADEHLADMNSSINGISLGINTIALRSDIEVGDAIIKRLNDKRQPLSTGIIKLDLCMDGGLYQGKVYGFAARKKVGKTTLAATISENLNRQGVKHLFICGEMSDEEIHERVLARKTKSFPSAFRTSYGQTPTFQNKIMQAIATGGNTLYLNAPGITFDALQRALAQALRSGIKGFILDYWQLVGGKPKSKSTAEHLDEVAQWVADFSRKHGLWAIVMAQVNQEGNTRGGEGIRLAFDQVYQLHREDITMPDAWLEMLETRYTKWQSIGSKGQAGLTMREDGPWFDEVL